MGKDSNIESYLEKIKKIIPYWIKHNREHINEHKNWMTDARKLGLVEIADELGEVIDLLKKANKYIDSINRKLNK